VLNDLHQRVVRAAFLDFSQRGQHLIDPLKNPAGFHPRRNTRPIFARTQRIVVDRYQPANVFLRPSARIREAKVFGFMPSRAAAPRGPATLPPAAFSAASTLSHSKRSWRSSMLLMRKRPRICKRGGFWYLIVESLRKQPVPFFAAVSFGGRSCPCPAS